VETKTERKLLTVSGSIYNEDQELEEECIG
jgi:hypothetical protein